MSTNPIYINPALNSQTSFELSQNLDTKILNSTTASLEILNCKQISLWVSEVSGNHSNHEITLEYSADDINWFEGTGSVISIGYAVAENTEFVKYVRAKCTTIESEGTESISNVIIYCVK